MSAFKSLSNAASTPSAAALDAGIPPLAVPITPTLRRQRPLERESALPLAGPRSVILEADDLGLLYAFNEGVLAAYRDGVLTSACLRANGYAYEHALREILPQCPGLGVGVHLCLNEGECVAPRGQVPRLLGSDGRLRGGFRWLMKLARDAAGLAEIERELRAQINKTLRDGLRVDHLNSHQHVHMVPEIFQLTCRLAREYGVPGVRLTRELPLWSGGYRRLQPLVNSNFVKHLLLNYFARLNEPVAREFGVITTDYFVGVNYTANMSRRTVRAGLRAAPYGSVEVLLHPAIGPDPRDTKYPVASLQHYVAAPQRIVELEALRSPKLSHFLTKEEWIPMDFATLAQQQRARQPQDRTPAISAETRRVCETAAVPGPLWVSQAQPDSRAFAQLVVTQARPGGRVLDVGTGTGILAVCLAMSGFAVVAVDISAAAVRAARANARRNGVDFPCHQSDLLSKVEGRFDLIAFNPPYAFAPDNLVTNLAKNLLRRVPWVRRNSGLAMPRTVLKFHQQLIARLIEQAPRHLTPDGAILLHAYEAEVSALSQVLPAGATVELLHHPALAGANRTVGMLIRFSST